MPCSRCTGCNAGPLSPEERHLMDLLAQRAFLPVARFLLENPDNSALSFVMSAPVYLETEQDTPQDLSRAGTALLSLQKRQYVTLDYNVPLQGFDYSAWERSQYYQNFAFSSTSEDGVPVLEPGSVALTLQGQEALELL